MTFKQKLPTHILLKYISEERFLTDFLNGSLYMNTLYYFWNEFMLEEARSGKRISVDDLAKSEKYGQLDLFEGTVGTEEIPSGSELSGHTMTDMCYRAVGYGYCNVLSFYNLNISYDGNMAYYDTNHAMSILGGYVAIVLDKEELVRRIEKKVKDENYRYLAGNVTYQSALLNGQPRKNGNALICKAGTDPVDIRNIKKKRDVFVKMDKYSYQNEWRVALYRDAKDVNAYRLEVGDLRDIVAWCKVGNLTKTIDECLTGMRVKSSDDLWYGNIKRSDMKELFYKLGDYKGERLIEIG